MGQKNVNPPHISQRGAFIPRKKQVHTLNLKGSFCLLCVYVHSKCFRVQQEEASHGSVAPMLHNTSAVV